MIGEAFGQELEILRRTAVDFSYLATQAGETRTIAARIPTLNATSGTLIVCIYNNKIDSSSSGTDVARVVLDASTHEQSFIGTQAITGGSVTLDKDSEANSFEPATITGDLGSMVAVQLVATQDTASSKALAIEISIRLILKNG